MTNIDFKTYPRFSNMETKFSWYEIHPFGQVYILEDEFTGEKLLAKEIDPRDVDFNNGKIIKALKIKHTNLLEVKNVLFHQSSRFLPG